MEPYNDICKMLGIEAFDDDKLTPLPVNGLFARFVNGKQIIALDPEMQDDKRRFVFAHEIGHASKLAA